MKNTAIAAINNEVQALVEGELMGRPFNEKIIPRPQIEVLDLESGLIMGQKEGLMCIMDPATREMVCPWVEKKSKFTLVDGINSCEIVVPVQITRAGEQVRYCLVGRINDRGVVSSRFVVLGREKVFDDVDGMLVSDLIQYATQMLQIDTNSTYNYEKSHGYLMRPQQNLEIV